MKKKNKIGGGIIFQGVLFLLVSIYAVNHWYQDYKDRKEINAFPERTVGSIIEYIKVVDGDHYLSYTYEVNGKVYENEIGGVNSNLFKDCYKTQDCIGRKFVVIYSSKNHEKSKIFLDEEIFDNDKETF